MEEYPNWQEMPRELMADIFQRLDTLEILNSAMEVCTTWKRICKDPAMWKVIDIRKPDDAPDADYDLDRLTKKAVNLSRGELIDISISGFGTDNLLRHIVLRSSKLKSVCLTDCYNISSSGLTQALERVPQLEKLHLSYITSMVDHINYVVPNCPQLKSFKLDKVFMLVRLNDDSDALAIAKKMPELRQLQLYGNNMTDIGLQAILRGCPHLVFLDVRTCHWLCLPGSVTERLCMERIKEFVGPNALTEDCGFHPRIYEDEYEYEYEEDYYKYLDYDPEYRDS